MYLLGELVDGGVHLFIDEEHSRQVLPPAIVRGGEDGEQPAIRKESIPFLCKAMTPTDQPKAMSLQEPFNNPLTKNFCTSPCPMAPSIIVEAVTMFGWVRP